MAPDQTKPAFKSQRFEHRRCWEQLTDLCRIARPLRFQTPCQRQVVMIEALLASGVYIGGGAVLLILIIVILVLVLR